VCPVILIKKPCCRGSNKSFVKPSPKQGPHLGWRCPCAGQTVELFELGAEVIRKGKAAKPTEFDKAIPDLLAPVLSPRTKVANRSFFLHQRCHVRQAIRKEQENQTGENAIRDRPRPEPPAFCPLKRPLFCLWKVASPAPAPAFSFLN
jgi:hypothetical protein